MSGRIHYNIVNGQPPFLVNLIPSIIPTVTHSETGEYFIDDVPNGDYVLTINDSNECQNDFNIVVNPNIITTTTTTTGGEYIIVGQTIDETLIFNTGATNVSDEYVGYPNENIVHVYLWFKTYDGSPLENSKIINLQINSVGGSTFQYLGMSDEINTELINVVTLTDTTILSVDVLLKEGFIETFFKYEFNKNINDSEYDIILSINDSSFFKLLPITVNNEYGFTFVDNNEIRLLFG